MSFAGSLGSIARGLNGTNDIVRDYTHASRTFHSDNYALLPKTKRWWHITFELTDSARSLYKTIANDMAGNGKRSNIVGDVWDDPASSRFISIMAKSVKLPGIKFDVKKHNNYNKQVININKVSYDSISATFHDDASGFVRSFWDAYYVYYVQDSRYREYAKIAGQGLPIPDDFWNDYNEVKKGASVSSSLYGKKALLQHHFGLDTVNSNTLGPTVDGYLDRQEPFLKSIKIYHFSRPSGTGDEKEFPHYTEYTLVNPVISSWDQDTLDYSTSESCVNTINIDFETVLYAVGKVAENGDSEIASWKQVTQTYYDDKKSPLPDAGQRLINTLIDVGTGKTSIAQAVSPQSILTNIRDVTTWAGKSVPGINAPFDGSGTGSKLLNAAQTSVQNYYSVGQSQINVPNGSGALNKLLAKVNKKPPSR